MLGRGVLHTSIVAIISHVQPPWERSVVVELLIGVIVEALGCNVYWSQGHVIEASTWCLVSVIGTIREAD